MSNEGSLSVKDRFNLIQTLNRLPDSQFKELVFALNPPRGILPSDLAALGDRVLVLLQWVEGTGPGLSVLQGALNYIVGADQPEPPTPSVPTFSFEAVTVDEKGNINRREQKTAEYYRQDLGGGVYIDMVKIPEGRFWMGSPESELERSDAEGPQHRVSISTFWMSRFPITQAQWRAVTLLDDVERALTPDPSHFKGDNRPVEQVSWDDAMEFCSRVAKHTGKDYRLPSEAEWEYACRAGTTTPFHFGPTITPELANYDGNSIYASGTKGKYQEQTTDVGSFPANGFGLTDMHGNVWEWCQDHWHDNYDGAPTDGSAWLANDGTAARVRRGGSWTFYPRHCRSASRYDFNPDVRHYNYGFRVCCSAPRT